MTKRKNTNDNDNNDAKRIGVSPGNPPQTINTNNLFQEPPIEPLTLPFHNSITNSPISDLSSSPDTQMDVMSPMSLENDYQEEVGVPLTRQQGVVDPYTELEEMNRQMRQIQEEIRRRSEQQGGKKRKKTNRKKSLKKNRKTKRKKSLKHRKTKRRYKKQGHK